MIIYGPAPLLAHWAGERIGVSDWGPCKCIGVMRRGEIVAVAVYNQWRHPNIEGSFVSTTPRWATPDAVRAMLRYPFVQLGCKRITATTEATNQRMRAFLCRLGFREEGVHPDALPTGDAVTLGLLRKDASRWIEEDRQCQQDIAA